MRRSHFLRRVRRAAVVLCFASSASAAELPEGTLALVAAKSLGDLDATAGRLLEPWRLKFNGLSPIFERLAPGMDAPSGPVAIGLAKNGPGLAPFALITTDRPEDLERALRARPAIDGKVGAVAGYPVFVSRPPGGICVVYSGAMRRVIDDIPLAEIESLLGDADAAVQITDLGFNEARVWSSRLGLSRGRIDWGRVRSLNGALRLLNRMGRYAPLFRALATQAKRATLRVHAGPQSDALDATLEVVCTEPIAAPPVADEAPTAPTLDALLGERTPILTLRADRALPAPVVSVALAWSESQPDEIDADRYDPRAFAAYAESAAELLGAARCLRLTRVAPKENEPLAINAVEYLRVQEGTDLLEAVEESTEALNQAIRRSRAGTPLLTGLDPLDTPNGPGVRMTTDVLKALGGDHFEAVRNVVERYYGPDGRHVVDVSPLGDDAWLRSSPPHDIEATRERLKAAQAPAAAAPMELRLWIDRWLAWRQRIDDVGKESDAGRKIRLPMAAAPPLRLQLSGEGERLRCEAELPTETYEAWAAYWIAKKVDQP